MNRLAETLERFNRKERNLLIRDVLGHTDTPLYLSARFRQRVAETLGIGSGIPADAWWATDYHINWLAGALAVYKEGDAALQKVRQNLQTGKSHLIEGNQEDVDLLIAFDNQLVFIEAKAYGHHSNKQLASKLERLDLLHAYCKSLSATDAGDVQFRFLLLSPNEPQKLVQTWPAWANNGTKVPWIELKLDPGPSVLNVTRCTEQGKSHEDGDKWKVIPN